MVMELNRAEIAWLCVSSALAFFISGEVMFVLALKSAKGVTRAQSETKL